jgi:hypothetical protein
VELGAGVLLWGAEVVRGTELGTDVDGGAEVGEDETTVEVVRVVGGGVDEAGVDD